MLECVCRPLGGFLRRNTTCRYVCSILTLQITHYHTDTEQIPGRTELKIDTNNPMENMTLITLYVNIIFNMICNCVDNYQFSLEVSVFLSENGCNNVLGKQIASSATKQNGILLPFASFGILGRPCCSLLPMLEF